MQTPSPPPHRPLGRTLIAGAVVIGFAFLGDVDLYFAPLAHTALGGVMKHLTFGMSDSS